MSSQLLWHSLYNYGSGNVKKERAKDCIIYSVETQQNVKEWAISYNLIFFCSYYSFSVFVCNSCFCCDGSSGGNRQETGRVDLSNVTLEESGLGLTVPEVWSSDCCASSFPGLSRDTELRNEKAMRKIYLPRHSHPSRKVPYQKFHKKAGSHENVSQTLNRSDKFRRASIKKLSNSHPRWPHRSLWESPNTTS